MRLRYIERADKHSFSCRLQRGQCKLHASYPPSPAPPAALPLSITNTCLRHLDGGECLDRCLRTRASRLILYLHS